MPSRNDHPKIKTPTLGASAVVTEPQPYMTQPIEKARRRPIMPPILPPVIMNMAITSV